MLLSRATRAAAVCGQRARPAAASAAAVRRGAPLRPLSSPVTLGELWPGMKKAKLLSWEVKEGQSVSAGDVLAMLDTEDAVVELHSEAAGYVTGLSIEPGAKVEVGDLLCRLEGTAQEAIDKAVHEVDPAVRAAAASPAAGSGGGAPKRGFSTVALSLAVARTAAPRRGLAASAAAAAAAATSVSVGAAGEARLMPSAARLVLLHGIDPASLRGSGKRGAITKGDVLVAVRDKTFRLVSAAKIPAAAAAAVPPAAKPSTPPASTQATGVVGSRSFARTFQDVPLTSVRDSSARRAMVAKQSVPHAYGSVECDVGAVNDLRGTLKKAGASSVPTVEDFCVRAAALAMRDVPDANSTWDAARGAAVRAATVDVGVAVAAPGGGIVTPVIRNVDGLRVQEISDRVASLGALARDGKLGAAESAGGSFSVLAVGGGADGITAVVEPPQACVLTVGAAVARVVPSLDPGTGAVVPKQKTVVRVTLSSDARVVGDDASGRFLEVFRRYLEQPQLMLR